MCVLECMRPEAVIGYLPQSLIITLLSEKSLSLKLKPTDCLVCLASEPQRCSPSSGVTGIAIIFIVYWGSQQVLLLGQQTPYELHYFLSHESTVKVEIKDIFLEIKEKNITLP